MPRRQIGTAEAAQACNREVSHIRRLCKQLGLGEMEYRAGRRRLLSSTELKALVKYVKDNGSDGRSRGRRGMKL